MSQNYNMDQEQDLGLEFLMNHKKKAPSDTLSISSRSSLPKQRTPNKNIEPEHIDVRQHLVPPSDEGDDVTYEEGDNEYTESYAEDTSDEGDTRFFGKSSGGYQQQSQPPRMSDDDVIEEKKDLLFKFQMLEERGIRLPRKFTLASNLEEMRMEYDRIVRSRELNSSIKRQKRWLMTAVGFIEMGVDKIPALGANLNGWSSQVHDELDEYEDIFEELHDKYKGKAKIAPELRLLGGLAGSAFMFHMTHKYSQSLPGLDQVLKSNPELAAKLAEATRTQMNHQQTTAGNFFGGLGNMFGNIFGGSAPPPPMPAEMAPQPQQQGVRMRGPQNVDDILSELNGMNMNDRVEMMSTIESELGDIADIPDDASSIAGIFTKKGKTIDLDI